MAGIQKDFVFWKLEKSVCHPNEKNQGQMLSEKLERWSNAAQQDQRGALATLIWQVLGTKTQDKNKIMIKWDQRHRKEG